MVAVKFWWKRKTFLYAKSLNFGMVAVKFWWKRNTLLYVKSLNFSMVTVKFRWKRETFLYAKSLNFVMVAVKFWWRRITLTPLISTGFLKYPLELKKNFSENWKRNYLVYNWIFIPVGNECWNGNFKKPVYQNWIVQPKIKNTPNNSKFILPTQKVHQASIVHASD